MSREEMAQVGDFMKCWKPSLCVRSDHDGRGTVLCSQSAQLDGGAAVAYIEWRMEEENGECECETQEKEQEAATAGETRGDALGRNSEHDPSKVDGSCRSHDEFEDCNLQEVEELWWRRWEEGRHSTGVEVAMSKMTRSRCVGSWGRPRHKYFDGCIDKVCM